MKYLTNSGLSYFLNKIKAYIASQLNSKASAIHTHTKSDIIDLPNGYAVDSTLDGTSSNAIANSAVVDALDGKSNTGHTHTKSQITDFPTLATVATSGSYNDLSNKPTIPTVNNATLTIQKNGTNVKTFTANASSDVTCNITVPTKLSELTNDSGFLTSHQSLSNYSTLANTIKSLSISGKTITYTKGDNSTGTLTTQDSNTWTAMKGATSSANGSVGYVNAVPPKDGYNTKYLRADGTWQVPPDHTYTVNNATLTIQKNGTTVKTFTANASSNVTCNITVPTKTSELTNNSGFLTSHQSLSGYVPRNGGAVMTGSQLGCVSNDSFLNFCGGTSWGDGATVSVRGKNTADNAGTVIIQAYIGTQGNQTMFICPNGTWAWSGTAVQVASDQRLKQQISNIDDKLLDAWQDVTPCQFKYNDAVEQKGDTARLHTGYVVQQIDEACKSHNLDISDYGLYCHEEYPQETEEVEVTQDDGTTKKETKVIREASEHYSLRYTEVYAVECMYLRRENSRLKEKLASIEERLEKLEKAEK